MTYQGVFIQDSMDNNGPLSELTYGEMYNLGHRKTNSMPKTDLVSGIYVGQKDGYHHFCTKNNRVYVVETGTKTPFAKKNQYTEPYIKVSSRGTLVNPLERAFLKDIIKKNK